MRRNKIITSTVALFFSIAMMVFGVYSAINPTATINGQVSYTVHDAKVLVQGKVNGALNESGQAVNGEYPTVSATYTDTEPVNEQDSYFDYTTGEGVDDADDDLDEWDIGALYFSESNQGIQEITISFKLTNKSVYPVKATLSFEEETLDNVVRTPSKTETVLGVTGQAGSVDEIVVTYNVDNDALDVNAVELAMNINFERTTIEPKTWEFTYENFETADTTETGLVITAYNGTDTEVVIPSELEYNGVLTPVIGVRGVDSSTSIFGNQNNTIVSVRLPESTLFIGSYSFAGCYGLRYITIGDRISKVEKIYSHSLPSTLDMLWLGNPKIIAPELVFDAEIGETKFDVISQTTEIWAWDDSGILMLRQAWGSEYTITSEK